MLVCINIQLVIKYIRYNYRVTSKAFRSISLGACIGNKKNASHGAISLQEGGSLEANTTATSFKSFSNETAQSPWSLAT